MEQKLELLKKIIQRDDLKKKNVAKILGLTSVYFSQILNKKYPITEKFCRNAEFSLAKYLKEGESFL